MGHLLPNFQPIPGFLNASQHVLAKVAFYGKICDLKSNGNVNTCCLALKMTFKASDPVHQSSVLRAVFYTIKRAMYGLCQRVVSKAFLSHRRGHYRFFQRYQFVTFVLRCSMNSSSNSSPFGSLALSSRANRLL